MNLPKVPIRLLHNSIAYVTPQKKLAGNENELFT
jgi:hypothetical protein